MLDFDQVCMGWIETFRDRDELGATCWIDESRIGVEIACCDKVGAMSWKEIAGTKAVAAGNELATQSASRETDNSGKELVLEEIACWLGGNVAVGKGDGGVAKEGEYTGITTKEPNTYAWTENNC